MTTPTQKAALDALEKLHGRCVKTAHSPGGESIINDWQETLRAFILAQPDAAPVSGEVEVTGETSDGYHTFNELYEHRHILFLAVLTANMDKAWRSKLHSDGTMFDGWFIAGLNTDAGQATYHLPIGMWELFRYIPELERAPEWDGHTSNDVLIRIRDMAFFDGVKAIPPVSSVPPIANSERDDRYWASIALLIANRKEADKLLTRHTVNDCLEALESALSPKADVSAPSDKERAKALNALEDALDGNEFSALYFLREHENIIRAFFSDHIHQMGKMVVEAAISTPQQAAPDDVLEGIKRYKAFSDFIFESLDIDAATTSITISHPVKGDYPIYLKEVQDDLDEVLSALSAAPDAQNTTQSRVTEQDRNSHD